MKTFVVVGLSVGLVSAGNVADMWDNHKAAVEAGDVEKALTDYTEDSCVSVYNPAVSLNASTNYKGLTAIRSYYEALFSDLSCKDCMFQGTPAPVIDETGSQVFTAWWNVKDSFINASSLYVLDENGKVKQQDDIYFKAEWNTPAPTEETTLRKLAAVEANETLQTIWNRHGEAFMAHDTPTIMLDYDANSVMNYYDGETMFSLNTVGDIDAFFVDFFKQMSQDGMEMPFLSLTDNSDFKQVFLYWNSLPNGFAHGFDMMIFRDDLKIGRHNLIRYKIDDSHAARSGSLVLGSVAVFLALWRTGF